MMPNMKTLRFKNPLIIATLTITAAVFALISPEKPDSRSQQAKAISKTSIFFDQVENIDTENNLISAIEGEIVEIEPELESEIILPEVVEIIDLIPTNSKAVIVLQESYTQSQIIDENWSEENAVKTRKNQWENLSFDELLAQKQIYMMESQLLDSDFESSEYTEIEEQVKQFVMEKYTLLDLHCGKALCRVVASLPYAASQHEFLKDFSSKFEWVDKSFAKVEINSDDSRTLILYLTRKVA